MAERRSKRVRIVLVVLGVILGAVFFARLGPRAIGAQLSHVGLDVLWVAVPYTLGTTVGAVPWAQFLPKRARPSWPAVIAGRFAASGANALLPFFGLAGEPSRLMWLAPRDRPRGTAAIVLDRVVYNEAGATLLLLGGVVAYLDTSLPSSLCLAAVLIAVALIVATLGILWAVSRWGIGDRLGAFLSKRFGNRLSHAGFTAEFDTSLAELLRAGIRPMWVGFAVHLLGRALLALEVYTILWVLGANATLEDAVVIATVPVATGIIASAIPSQVGVQEAAQTLVCEALGLNPALGFTLVLIMRMRQLLFVPLTPVLLGIAHAPAADSALLRARSDRC